MRRRAGGALTQPPLPLPKVVTGPRMCAEEVILECMRNNEYLCAEQLPRDLFEEFGRLLDAEPDPSASPILEFFLLACLPQGTPAGGNAIVRNQVCVCGGGGQITNLRGRSSWRF